MKLLSVTIQNYRVHRNVTVNFDDSRTVVSGQNETGKSTLVECVNAALFLRSRVTGAIQKGMLSEFHTGGHPTVELKFESGGREYTITKVFSGNQSASTTLRDQPAQRSRLDQPARRGEHAADGGSSAVSPAGSPAGSAAGSRTLRDEEAEEKIHEIIQAEDIGGGRNLEARLKMQWAHLWVWQGASTEDPLTHANADRHAQLLRERLSRVEGGGVLESPLDAAAARDIAARHADTFTDKGKPRSGSGLDVAMKSLEAAEAARAQAVGALETLDEAVDTIDTTSRTIAICDAKLGEAREELEQVRTNQGQATALAVTIAEEQAAAATAEAAHAEAVRADAEIVVCRNEIAAIESKIGPDLATLENLRQFEQACSDRCDAATRAMMAAGRRQAEATAAFALHDMCEKHELLLVEREGLGGRCKLIAEQRSKLQDLTALRDLVPQVTDAELATITRLDRERELAEATLEAIATKVEVVAASGPVTLGGAVLGPGMPVTITGDAELAVGAAGAVATVRISPGGGRSLAEATQRLDEARAALEAALVAAGIESVEAVRGAHSRRQALDADIHAVRLAIEGLGGDQADAELAGLDAKIARAAAEVLRRSPAGFTRPASLAAAQAAVATAEGELAAAGEAVMEANREVTDARMQLDNVADRHRRAADSLRANRAELDSLRTKATVLEERHGTDRAPKIVALAHASDTAAARVSASRARLARLAPEALELDRRRLERALTNLAATKQEAETSRRIARAKLELEGTTDPREDLARATARRRLAAADQARAAREADAVKLLASLFNEKKREVESQFVAPLTNRVQGYLERLYGEGTTVSVDYENGRFSRLTLSRRGVNDATYEFSQLSSGAKEQTAAAFRLAMAEVLAADHDGCLPVVFDDAFVNSDADRQAALQRMLDLAASRGVQVIVLSCRPETYATLGAKMIKLPDNPFAAGERDSGDGLTARS
jgi:hypothetical protein